MILLEVKAIVPVALGNVCVYAVVVLAPTIVCAAVAAEYNTILPSLWAVVVLTFALFPNVSVSHAAVLAVVDVALARVAQAVQVGAVVVPAPIKI